MKIKLNKFLLYTALLICFITKANATVWYVPIVAQIETGSYSQGHASIIKTYKLDISYDRFTFHDKIYYEEVLCDFDDFIEYTGSTATEPCGVINDLPVYCYKNEFDDITGEELDNSDKTSWCKLGTCPAGSFALTMINSVHLGQRNFHNTPNDLLSYKSGLDTSTVNIPLDFGDDLTLGTIDDYTAGCLSCKRTFVFNDVSQAVYYNEHLGWWYLVDIYDDNFASDNNGQWLDLIPDPTVAVPSLQNCVLTEEAKSKEFSDSSGTYEFTSCDWYTNTWNGDPYF